MTASRHHLEWFLRQLQRLLLQVPAEQKRPSQQGSPAPPQCVQVLFEHAFDAEQ